MVAGGDRVRVLALRRADLGRGRVATVRRQRGGEHAQRPPRVDEHQVRVRGAQGLDLLVREQVVADDEHGRAGDGERLDVGDVAHVAHVHALAAEDLRRGAGAEVAGVVRSEGQCRGPRLRQRREDARDDDQRQQTERPPRTPPAPGRPAAGRGAVADDHLVRRDDRRAHRGTATLRSVTSEPVDRTRVLHPGVEPAQADLVLRGRRHVAVRDVVEGPAGRDQLGGERRQPGRGGQCGLVRGPGRPLVEHRPLLEPADDRAEPFEHGHGPVARGGSGVGSGPDLARRSGRRRPPGRYGLRRHGGRAARDRRPGTRSRRPPRSPRPRRGRRTGRTPAGVRRPASSSASQSTSRLSSERCSW